MRFAESNLSVAITDCLFAVSDALSGQYRHAVFIPVESGFAGSTTMGNLNPGGLNQVNLVFDRQTGFSTPWEYINAISV
jgi:hypothetical protein